jgi:phosphoenolpyruvate carboxykinase (ATP)
MRLTSQLPEALTMTHFPSFAHSHVQLSAQELVNAALARNEGTLCANGAFSVTTGKRTGRSPKDKFIVQDSTTQNTVAWGPINQPITADRFNALWQKTVDYLTDKEVFISYLKVGADAQYGLPVTLITEQAWQNLFGVQLFIRENTQNADPNKQWTILSAPGHTTSAERDGVNSDGCVMINFTERKVLLSGMRYAGEIKKAMFSVLNFLLPAQDVLPMHCSANVGKAGDVALFFGLSGTGKTTLSADPERFLVGDDEHGWSATGVFNFEGGCYAKCINLSEKNEPMIWAAIRENTVMENVVLDETSKAPLYDNTSLTENTRVAYPRDYIPGCVPENSAGHPRSVIFLTCDLYGVLPPVALLTPQQAAYYFLSGYTALVGSTEVGSTAGIKPTFSTCFGAPFFPRPPMVYADLLMKRIAQTKAQVYLVNTGWTGGGYGQGGSRFDIPTTRAIIHAVLSGQLVSAPQEILPGFNFAIPKTMEGVNAKLLHPQRNWQDPSAYDDQAKILIAQFIENFEKFNAPAEIQAAGPLLSSVVAA